MGISPVRFCCLQLTDMSRLSAAKLYRGFESRSLRQQVLTAEKFCRPLPRDTRNMPLFRGTSPADCRERTAQLRTWSLSRLFSAGHMYSPVSRRALAFAAASSETSRESVDTCSPYRSTRSFNRRGSRVVASRRSPDARTASAISRPKPLALPVTNYILDIRTSVQVPDPLQCHRPPRL